MKLVIESILFLAIMNMIGLLDTRLRRESSENQDLKMQVAAYEDYNRQVAEVTKTQVGQLIALR